MAQQCGGFRTFQSIVGDRRINAPVSRDTNISKLNQGQQTGNLEGWRLLVKTHPKKVSPKHWTFSVTLTLGDRKSVGYVAKWEIVLSGTASDPDKFFLTKKQPFDTIGNTEGDDHVIHPWSRPVIWAISLLRKKCPHV